MRIFFGLLLLAPLALALPLGSRSEGVFVGNASANWDWDLPLVEFARDHARVSYCDDDTIGGWHCDICTGDFVVKHVIAESSNPDKLQGYVGYSVSQKLIVVSFRGSVNIPNWIADLKFDKIDSDFNDRGCDGCKIHRGFFEAYVEVSDQLTGIVNELSNQFPDFMILTTGHSLGGAMAIHAALDLAVNHNHAHRLDTITFGQPRMGNENFAKFCVATIPQVTRVVHQADIVTHLPPHEGPLAMEFHHNAREVWNIDDATGVQMCDASGEDKKCSNSVPIWRYSIPDHLWYFGAPHGCTAASIKSPKELERIMEVQAETIAYLMQHH